MKKGKVDVYRPRNLSLSNIERAIDVSFCNGNSNFLGILKTIIDKKNSTYKQEIYVTRLIHSFEQVQELIIKK